MAISRQSTLYTTSMDVTRGIQNPRKIDNPPTVLNGLLHGEIGHIPPTK
jgi:hypothetical protein